MPHADTVFAQLLKLVPRHEFDRLAKSHHSGGRLRRMTRWSQFTSMVTGHVARRHSLRDVIATLQAQERRLYHLGSKPVTRSSLARVNKEQPYALYEALFARLYARTRAHTPDHRFRFTNKLYSLDASLIELSLAIFPWSRFALGKGAMKLHLGLDHDGLIPAFAVVTESRVMETTVARQLMPVKGSITVFDRGYSSYSWLKTLDESGVYFVTRLRANTLFEVVEEHQYPPLASVEGDQIVQFTGQKAVQCDLPRLRLVTARCPNTARTYRFVTNIRHLAASTIAAIYKSRWEIELFFKFLKQNLKLKGFYGTSKNAVLTQIWIALCVSLMVAWLKFTSGLSLSLQKILRLIETNLFLRRDLLDLLKGRPPDPPSRHPNQTAFVL